VVRQQHPDIIRVQDDDSKKGQDAIKLTVEFITTVNHVKINPGIWIPESHVFDEIIT